MTPGCSGAGRNLQRPQAWWPHPPDKVQNGRKNGGRLRNRGIYHWVAPGTVFSSLLQPSLQHPGDFPGTLLTLSLTRSNRESRIPDGDGKNPDPGATQAWLGPTQVPRRWLPQRAVLRTECGDVCGPVVPRKPCLSGLRFSGGVFAPALPVGGAELRRSSCSSCDLVWGGLSSRARP